MGNGLSHLDNVLFEARSAEDVARALAAGSNMDSKTIPGGITPLMQVAGEGAASAVDALLQAGADTTAVDDLSMSALHWACARAQSHLVEAQSSLS